MGQFRIGLDAIRLRDWVLAEAGLNGKASISHETGICYESARNYIDGTAKPSSKTIRRLVEKYGLHVLGTYDGQVLVLNKEHIKKVY